MLNCYVIQARSHALLKKNAINLGRAEAPHFCSTENGPCTFIGLYDMYCVEGPLRTGAILGHSSYWSRKTRPTAERRVGSEHQLLAAVQAHKTSRKRTDYLFKAVYHLSSVSVPREKRRTIEAWLLINASSGKQLVEFAKEIAAKRTTKQRLLKMLADRAMPADLHFCGFVEAREAFDPPVRVGRCFLSDVKDFTSLSRIRALIKKDRKSALA